MLSYIKQIIQLAKQKNPHQPEFLQTVKEILESIKPVINQNSKYFKANILERIIEPERQIIFRVPWSDDKGNIKVNRGFRVQFNSALGPYKGGLRFHPSVNLSILKFLAFEQTFKNALTGLPLGGAKGGSDFDPKGKSDLEIMRFCQSFMLELFRHIGPDTDVPAGDIGVGGREIGYLFGQYKRIQNNFTGVLTGKAVNWGGSLMRPEATGYGSVYFAQEMLKTINKSLEQKICTVSGSGNVAQHTVEKLIELGAKVITMSDSHGTIFDKHGISKEKLLWIKELKNIHRGRIKDYTEKFKAEYFENKKPWNIPCDCAFPSATQNEISIKDAKNLLKNKCYLVNEGANMPCDSEAVKLFLEKKILFGPAKAANAGGVAVSGMEMSQNSMRLKWTAKEVDKKLKEIMIAIHKNCLATAEQYNAKGNLVAGANIAGFKKVADAMIEQGIV
ncbi:MAG: NADP-specific glutamate dehydrogenase [Patescibacteria group bacterium]